MYLLIAYAGTWLVLLGSFCATWEQLQQPWTVSDLVVITIIGTAVLGFARHGLVSLLALMLRLLPAGRVRSTMTSMTVRLMPRILTASVLAVVSAGLVVPAAHALPVDDSGSAPETGPIQVASTQSMPADPGWPTVEDTTTRGSDDGNRLDPAWPTEPPEDPSSTTPPAAPPQPRREPGAEGPSAPPPEPGADPGRTTDPPKSETHVVEAGESLWVIASGLAASDEDIPRLVDDIYSANRTVIGPDPSLIIAGQRLEIQP